MLTSVSHINIRTNDIPLITEKTLQKVFSKPFSFLIQFSKENPSQVNALVRYLSEPESARKYVSILEEKPLDFIRDLRKIDLELFKALTNACISSKSTLLSRHGNFLAEIYYYETLANRETKQFLVDAAENGAIFCDRANYWMPLKSLLHVDTFRPFFKPFRTSEFTVPEVLSFSQTLSEAIEAPETLRMLQFEYGQFPEIKQSLEFLQELEQNIQTLVDVQTSLDAFAPIHEALHKITGKSVYSLDIFESALENLNSRLLDRKRHLELGLDASEKFSKSIKTNQLKL